MWFEINVMCAYLKDSKKSDRERNVYKKTKKMIQIRYKYDAELHRQSKVKKRKAGNDEIRKTKSEIKKTKPKKPTKRNRQIYEQKGERDVKSAWSQMIKFPLDGIILTSKSEQLVPIMFIELCRCAYTHFFGTTHSHTNLSYFSSEFALYSFLHFFRFFVFMMLRTVDGVSGVHLVLVCVWF